VKNNGIHVMPAASTIAFITGDSLSKRAFFSKLKMVKE
jgi:hypothetical protein